MAYGFPLVDIPTRIREFRVLKSLGRGFYAATYLVESGTLRHRDVLKVAPVEAYRKFGKDFIRESLEHKRVADGSEHLATIRDVFGDDAEGFPVNFGEHQIQCHISVLEYVEGRPLREYLRGENRLAARAAAQIAIDLLRLLQELEVAGIHHNDLHEDNVMVQELPPNRRRGGALDESIRAVAIDMGSVAEASATDPAERRLGDVQQVASHLRALSLRLLTDPDAASDDDYRLASALEQLAQQMTPLRENQRPLDYEEQIETIREVVFFTDSPWRDPGQLKRFGEAYNAATLKSWYLPKLLVDPAGDWLSRISTAGPQLITGMRGCGKTMLLRALEIHGRAMKAQQETGEPQIGRWLESDGFVGLYESATRLLDRLGDEPDESNPTPLHEPQARLFVAYAREALQALRHLSYIDSEFVRRGAVEMIGRSVAEHLSGGSEDLGSLTSDIALERALQRTLLALGSEANRVRLVAHPSVAFRALADAVRRSSPLWRDATVLFLLDDVSTRNLDLAQIRPLISSLLFKDDLCAFKLTTEAQTVEQLRSPGMLETAQIGRDVDVFDLGAAVNEQMTRRGSDGGRQFIAQILAARAQLYRDHPPASPEHVLGTATLESIARDIGRVGAQGEKKATRIARETLSQAYHGMAALSAVCVGDVGDVISIYETMLRSAGPNPTLPLGAQLQSSAFQAYCVRRLYHLNRRGDDLRDYALSFARAAHLLLVESARRSGGRRLRQYTSIHLQLDPDRQRDDFARILRLIDAGVFVFEDGAHGPRLKTGDADPRSSFILNYRKLFGLSSYIGLAERDRFELRGSAIREWLDNPDDHTQLTRRLGVERSDEHYEPPEPVITDAHDLGRLFDDREYVGHRSTAVDGRKATDDARSPEEKMLDEAFLRERVPHVERRDLRDEKADTVVLALGFEERSLASAQRVLDATRPRRVLLVRYLERGRGPKILRLVRESGVPYDVVDYEDIREARLPLSAGRVLLDTTGLTKPLIFGAVRAALRRDGEVSVVHTQAERHWPLNEDIEPLLRKHEHLDSYSMIEAMSSVHSGDLQPYRYIKLLDRGNDEARSRVLCAGASAKHERLLSFLERREYDHLAIVTPTSDSPRGRLAALAAEIARRGAASATVTRIGSDALIEHLEFLGRGYRAWFNDGMDVELALTASKMQAVACAALSTAVKIAECWYVRPRGFDAARFSVGVGATETFRIVSRSTVAKRPVTADDRIAG